MTALERDGYQLKSLKQIPEPEAKFWPWTLQKFRMHSRADMQVISCRENCQACSRGGPDARTLRKTNGSIFDFQSQRELEPFSPESVGL